jgi:acyl-CoA thioesterase-2
MADFEEDTRVEGTDGSYRALLSPNWAVWGPSGGYLAALALRAAASAAAIRRPATFNCHFLGIARFAEVQLKVVPIRTGGRSESIGVTMFQDDRPIVHGILRTAAEGPGLEHDTARAMESRGPDELKTWRELFPEVKEMPFPLWNNIDVKPTDPEVALDSTRPHPPTYRQWSRFRSQSGFDDPFVDAGRALLLLDTMCWAAASRPHPRAGFFAPSLDVSAWFHRLDPQSDWLLSEHESSIAHAGLMAASGRVFSQAGRLLASGGSQLMCIPTKAPADRSTNRPE